MVAGEGKTKSSNYPTVGEIRSLFTELFYGESYGNYEARDLAG